MAEFLLLSTALKVITWPNSRLHISQFLAGFPLYYILLIIVPFQSIRDIKSVSLQHGSVPTWNITRFSSGIFMNILRDIPYTECPIHSDTLKMLFLIKNEWDINSLKIDIFNFFLFKVFLIEVIWWYHPHFDQIKLWRICCKFLPWKSAK